MSAADRGETGLDLSGLGAGVPPLGEMYRALVEEIPAILYLNGPEEDSPTLFVSPQTQEILGLPPEGWYDNTWTRHVHPEDRDAMQDNYVRALRHGAVDIDEYRFVKPDGEVIWLRDTIRIIRDEDGRPVFVQGVMVDITARKRQEDLLARESRANRRVAAIGQRFTELLLGGGDLQAILDTLAEIVGQPVVFDDAARQLVGYAVTRGVGEGEVLDRWEEHSRALHGGDRAPGCAWVPVRLRDEEWGRLHALTGTDGDEVDEIDRMAIDRAAAAIGLWLLPSRDRAALTDRARSEFISDLWRGRRWTAADARARSRSLGTDLDQPVQTGLAVEFVHEPGPAALAEDPGAGPMLTAAQRHLQHAAAAERATCMSAVVGQLCVAIIGLPGDAPARVVGERVAERLRRTLAADLQGADVAVGISRPGSADTLRRALTEAVDAAAHGARSLAVGGIYHSADLGLRHLLSRLGDGPELSRFVEDELGPLLAHDAAGRLPLLPTLRAFLDSGGQKTAAARSLHLDRRSLYYRLERIQALLETDLTDATARLRTQVALQGLDVLRQRRGPVAGPWVGGP